MKTFSWVLVMAITVSVAGAACTPAKQRQQAQPKQPEHPAVVSADSHLPKINYVEQVRDIRRNLERRPHVKTLHHNPRDKSHYVEHEVVVRFHPRPDKATIDSMLKKVDAKVKRDYGKGMIIKSNSMTTEQLMRHFAEHPDSIYAEPNYLLLPNAVMPNDSYYKKYQWNLPMIGMEQSWDISKGSSDIVVAVVDTGVDMKHPEFKDKLVAGHNFINNSNRPQDDNGHGTHVSGIIAARTNNNAGVAGMSWNSKIMPVKAIGSDGSGTAFDIAQGIYWATDHGASVINLSVGNYTPSAALKEACRYAYDHNVVLVAASGNDNSDQPSYPAAYPEVIAVAAVDHLKNRAEFSNYGDYVAVAAPGVDIPSTYIDSDYAALSGTSMACPHVTALASLIRSVKPDLAVDDVIMLIKQTAADLGKPGKDPMYGYGLIDVNNALSQVQATAKPEAAAPVTTIGGLIDKFLMRLRFGF